VIALVVALEGEVEPEVTTSSRVGG